jgi:hypothetical protein
VPKKLFNALVGVVWIVSGALMAFNPAPPHQPHDRSRAAMVPYIGVVVIAAGIWFIVRAVREARTAAASPSVVVPSTRHAAAADMGESVRMIGLCLAVVGMGVGTLWWGIAAGLLSVVGLATSILGPAALVAVSRVVLAIRARR